MPFTRFPRFHPAKNVMLEQTAQAKKEESALFLELWVDFCVCFGYSYWIFWAEKKCILYIKRACLVRAVKVHWPRIPSHAAVICWNLNCSERPWELGTAPLSPSLCWYKSRIAFTWSPAISFPTRPLRFVKEVCLWNLRKSLRKETAEEFLLVKLVWVMILEIWV